MIYLGIESLGYRIHASLDFLGNDKLFWKMVVQIYMPTSKLWGWLSIHQHFCLANFKIFDNLVSVQWHLFVILICIFLITNEVEHLCTHMIIICFLFSSLRCSFKPSGNFLIGLISVLILFLILKWITFTFLY